MALERTEAIVLRSIKFGDSSRILTFLTRRFGRVKAIGKGVRSARPRFGAALEPFARLDLVFYRKTHGDLHLISQADLIDGHLALSGDVSRYAFASAAVEFVGQVVSEEEETRAAYEETAGVLAAMGGAPREALPHFLRAFQIKVAAHLGHGPELGHCLGCGVSLEAGAPFFSPSAGGVMCAACGHDTAGAVAISPAALKALRTHAGQPLEEAGAQRLSPAARAETGRLVDLFLAAQLESYRGLKSLKLAAWARKD